MFSRIIVLSRTRLPRCFPKASAKVKQIFEPANFFEEKIEKKAKFLFSNFFRDYFYNILSIFETFSAKQCKNPRTKKKENSCIYRISSKIEIVKITIFAIKHILYIFVREQHKAESHIIHLIIYNIQDILTANIKSLPHMTA